MDGQRAGASAEERVWGAVSAEVQVEAILWRLLPERFAGVDRSPVAPLGTCSALGPVDRHRVVSTMRGTEVLSDPTNALAVEAAARRRGQGVDGRVDLAACHRVLRAQQFGPGRAAHFRLFALTSSARDHGSGRTDAQLVIDHISFWQRALAEALPTVATRITVTVFGSSVLAERLADTIGSAVAGDKVPVVEDPARDHGAGYHAGLAMGLRAEAGGQSVDIGDGGLTTWTRQLRGGAKERYLARSRTDMAWRRCGNIVPCGSYRYSPRPSLPACGIGPLLALLSGP